MTDHRRTKLDRKKLVSALEALARGRARLKEEWKDGAKGDPFWGPILGDLGNALVVLERRLDDAEDAEGEQS